MLRVPFQLNGIYLLFNYDKLHMNINCDKYLFVTAKKKLFSTKI